MNRPALDAAARDRGLTDAEAAVAAARAFYRHMSGAVADSARVREQHTV
ncbi:hypothetical protein O7599_15325 [Streptomyces sp. WMMC500]|nr:hypothetical protein [Streptomyces sp. WMMC500]WBB63803.1 hypothetical protein O7599_15325 [Streptomyces sp. WMMC500]